MTRKRARQLLARHWGHGIDMNRQDEREIEAVMHRGDSYLCALQRIAGDDYEWRLPVGQQTSGLKLSDETMAHFRSLSVEVTS